MWTVTWVSFAAIVIAVTGGWLFSWVSGAFVWRPVALGCPGLVFGSTTCGFDRFMGRLESFGGFLGFLTVFVCLVLRCFLVSVFCCFLGLVVGASLLPEAAGARQKASRGPRQPLQLRVFLDLRQFFFYW